MAADRIGSLPDRPLTKGDIQSLATHPDVAVCHPVYRLTDDEDAVVAVFFGFGDRFHILIYDPDEQAWERVDTVESWEGLTEDTGLDENLIQERFDALYDDDEVEPAGYLNDPLEGFALNLPQEPLTGGQIAAIGEREFIPKAIPFTRRKTDDRYVTFVLAFDEPIERRRFFAAYGYDPDEGAWQVAHSTDVTDVEQDDEAVYEELAKRITNWLTDHYALDELAVDENSDELSL